MKPTAEMRVEERRRHRRHAVRAIGTVNCGRILIPCIVTNLSRGGALIRLFDARPLPREPVQLEVLSLKKLLAVAVVWQKGEFAGLKFAAEIALDPPAQSAAA